MNTNNIWELEEYIKRISCFKRISKKRERDLAKIIAKNFKNEDGQKAIKELVESNLFLVVDIAAKKMQYNNIDVMDMIYVGNLALYRAAKQYSAFHKSRAGFSTCAYLYIVNAIANLPQNRVLYLPKDFDKYELAIRDFEMSNNKKASFEDISKICKVSLNRAKEIKHALNDQPVFLEGLNDDGYWEDKIGEKDNTIKRNMLRSDMIEFVKKLRPNRKQIIEDVFLNDGLDYVESAKIYGCSKQCVEILCKRGLRELKIAILKEWDKEHGTKTEVIDGKTEGRLKCRKGKEGRHRLAKIIEQEQIRNGGTYKEILAYYLGK